MAIGNNRNPDLMEVFDARWKANHNNEFIKQKNEESKNFTDRMFGNNNLNNRPSIPNTKEEQLKNLNNRIESQREYMNQNRVGNIVNKFKQ